MCSTHERSTVLNVTAQVQCVTLLLHIIPNLAGLPPHEPIPRAIYPHIALFKTYCTSPQIQAKAAALNMGTGPSIKDHYGEEKWSTLVTDMTVESPAQVHRTCLSNQLHNQQYSASLQKYNAQLYSCISLHTSLACPHLSPPHDPITCASQALDHHPTIHRYPIIPSQPKGQSSSNQPTYITTTSQMVVHHKIY